MTARIELAGGLAELRHRFAELGGRKLGAIQRKAMNAGAQVLVEAIRARAKSVENTGALERSIGKKVKVYRENGVAVGLAGPRTKYRKEYSGRRGGRIVRQPSRTLHIVERGSKRSRAKPVVGPAIAAAAGAATAAATAKAAEELGKL